MEPFELAIYDEKIKSRWLEVADEKSYSREIIFAIQAIRNNELLQKSDPVSIRNAVINIALTGATLNPVLQQAFLIPRKIKGIMKTSLDFSYRGLIKVAVDSGSVYDIEAAAVFEGDEFHWEKGLYPVLVHKPIMKEDDEKRRVVAAYAIATLHHDLKRFEVIDREKIERARKSSQTSNIWDAHYDEMAKKTVIKLLYKTLPQTEKMSIAVATLNEHEGLPGKDESKAIEVMGRFGIGEHKESSETDDDSGNANHSPDGDNAPTGKETALSDIPGVSQERAPGEDDVGEGGFKMKF